LIHDRKVASRTIDKELKTAGHEVADEGFNLPRGHEPHAGKFSVVAERSVWNQPQESVPTTREPQIDPVLANDDRNSFNQDCHD
jgi:hypothetical protein